MLKLNETLFGISTTSLNRIEKIEIYPRGNNALIVMYKFLNQDACDAGMVMSSSRIDISAMPGISSIDAIENYLINSNPDYSGAVRT